MFRLGTSATEKYNRLSYQRNIAINCIKEAYDIAQRAKADNTLYGDLSSRYEDVLNEFSNFRELHNQIIGIGSVLGDDEFKKQDEVRAVTSKAFYGFKATYHEIFPTNVATAPSVSTTKSSVRLPKLELKTFSGDFKEWCTFFDMYNSSIHNNTSLTDIEKFQYLISYLDKEPLSLIRSIKLTSDNYDVAYNTLVKKYQNHRLIATHFWNEIFFCAGLKGDNNLMDLSRLLNTFSENLEGLKNLQYPTDSWDFIIFNLLLYKIDSDTRNKFEFDFANKPVTTPNGIRGNPTYNDLYSFLESQLRAMQTSNAIQNTSNFKSSKNSFFNSNSNRFSSKSNQGKKPSVAYLSTGTSTCVLCKEKHNLESCSKFLSKTPHARYNLAKSKNLCLACLSGTHGVKQCDSRQSCTTCGSHTHHFLLHFTKNVNTEMVRETPSTSGLESMSANGTSNKNDDVNACTTLVKSKTLVSLLPTAIVEILDSRGNFVKVRALLDSGAAANFISEGCIRRLGLSRQYCNINIAGIGNSSNTISKGIAECLIKSARSFEPQISLKVFVLSDICAQLPNHSVEVENSQFGDLDLADKNFWKPGKIDLLLGAEIFPLILKPSGNILNSNQPMFFETIFGWVAIGNCKSSSQETDSSFPTFCCSTFESIDKNLKKLWEIESVPNKVVLSPEAEFCEEFFEKTHFRNCSSKYVVALPFKIKNPAFGESRELALRRFYSLENKLYKNPALLDAYKEFMKNYLNSGYMSPIDRTGKYYIPHHCVIKEESISTKLRVVFDASMKSSNGVSLNDTLYAGPKLHADISSVLLRFRLHKYCLLADIRQMFLQIGIREEDRDFQTILWRFDRQGPVQDYRLDTVVFGVSSSPYLANRTIRQLALDEKDSFPLASEILLNDIYVDDILTGFDRLQEAHQVKSQLTELLKKGGFDLRKWASNCQEILANIPLEHQQPISFDSEEPSSVKVLGLRWLPANDYFTYHISDSFSHHCTKRTILSSLARIFDPLGMISPITLFAKRLIQYLWTLGLDWNDQAPQDVVLQWTRFQSELKLLSKLQIPRHIEACKDRCELHAFCDASESGYGTVVYLRVEIDQEVKIFFVAGKSKVTPLKRITLPRLELCAAVLLSNLVEFILNSISKRVEISNIFAWSDSKVTLSWIKSSPHRWQTFVSNRVSHIQDKVSPERWRYVPTEYNPADCASRGLFPLEMVEHPIWFNAPDFLLESSENWPEDISEDTNLEHLEEKRIVLAAFITHDGYDILLKYSSLEKILRIVGYICRILLIKQYNPKRSGPLIENDLHQALMLLVKKVQFEVFSETIAQLKQGKCISKSLRKLNPFIDDSGLLRVGGRLSNSLLSYDKKFPLLLPSKHRLTELIIENIHKKNLHPGLQTLHFLIQQQFWILSAKKAIRRCLSRCYRCFRVNPKPVVPFMSDLPASRVSQIKPFQEIGVDFAGPFSVTLGKSRGVKSQKAYVCIFICFATKAIHLELVSSLSTDAFLAALRRFIARRGRCNKIHSDCGTNFVGASRQLVELMKDAVESEKIKWYFNPPSAPNFGGLWEAGVRSMKSHLIRVVGLQVMTYEEFYTILVQIESILNSRPLHPTSSDPNDISALTPGHFLTLEPLTSLPCEDYSQYNINTLQRWQLLQRLHGDFWKRWHRDYLNTLQQRNKWTTKRPDLKVGDLVVVKDELRSPLRWLLARIVEAHPGSDGICRVYTIKTCNGTLQRPASKLCLLPDLGPEQD